MRKRGYMQYSRYRSIKCVLGFYKKLTICNFSQFRVFFRCACLGHDVLKILGRENIALNHQKSSMDHVLYLSNNSKISLHLSKVSSCLLRKDIALFIYRQSKDFFVYKNRQSFLWIPILKVWINCL